MSIIELSPFLFQNLVRFSITSYFAVRTFLSTELHNIIAQLGTFFKRNDIPKSWKYIHSFWLLGQHIRLGEEK